MHVYNESIELRNGRWDGITFVPRRPVEFYGFGLYAESNFKDLNIEVRWEIQNRPDDSKTFNLTLRDNEKDKDNKWHIVNIE